MQTIASIYVRTPQGRVTAFSPTTRLPEQLKSLLQAVDGQTASSAIAVQFSSLGNVTRMLHELETAGLITDKDTTTRALPFEQDADEIWGLPRNTPPRPALHIVPSAYSPNPSVHSLLTTPVPQSSAWQQTTAGGLEDGLPVRSLETILADLTQQVADFMATFVLTHLPSQAFAVLRELETLRSPAQLKATLPSYEALVLTVGQVGRQHASDLRRLIEKQFVASY
jgi:hypothetical protein